MSQKEQIEQAILVLEAQRSIIGDAVVEASLSALRKQLSDLEVGRPDEERKLVTVLFADLVGFTAMADKSDPEDLRLFQQVYFSAVSRPIREQGGWIEKYIGDAVVAVFGLPQAREDDPDRALRAALSMHTALDELNSHLHNDHSMKWVPNLKMRIGVNTGLVIVKIVDEQDFDITGDMVNLTSRLQTAASPGKILISQDTYRHVRGAFDLQELAPITVKGKDDPLQVYQVNGEKKRSFRTRKRGVEGVETRMIGREGELHRLQNAYLSSFEFDEHCMITIVGDPGLGKSRLMYEFENWVDLRQEQVTPFRGRARLETQRLPYGMWRDLFAFRFGIQDDDSIPMVWEKFEAGFGESGGESKNKQMKAHMVGQMLGFNFQASPHLLPTVDNPRQILDRGYTYLLEYFKAVAGMEMVLIFLEDLHWADEASMTLLDWLAQQLANHPVLIVGTARPVLYENRQYWMEGREFHQRLDLRPLSRRESRLLVENLLQKMQELPETLRDLVVTNAEGNPFYVEELAKMLIEEGVIDKSGERWRFIPEKLTGIRVPPTLIGVLQARLDSLPLDERTVIQQASVVGRVFWDRALIYINQSQGGKQDEEEVLLDLVRLRDREMLYQRENSTFAGARELIFKHAILREVAFESLLKRVRRQYHHMVAEWLVESTEASGRVDEYTGLIADHYDKAGEQDQAVDWAIRAGNRALLQGASREAGRFFDRALELLPEEPSQRRWQAIKGRGNVLSVLGRADDYSLLIDQALELARHLNDPGHHAEALYWKALSFAARGDDRSAVEIYREALTLARKSSEREIEAKILAILAISLVRLGENTAALVAAEEAVSAGLQANDTKVMNTVYNNASVCYIELGDLAKGIHYLNLSLESAQQQNDQFSMANTLSNLGYVYIQLGMVEKGGFELERSLGLYKDVQSIRSEAYAGLNLALAHILMKEITNAVDLLTKNTETLINLNDEFGQAAGLSYRGLALEVSGQFEAASEAFQQAMVIQQRNGIVGYSYDAQAGLVRCLLEEKKLDEALQHIWPVWKYLQEHQGANMEFPIRAYLTCQKVFMANDESVLSRSALEQGNKRLGELAMRISDSSWRQSYLEEVPWHREMLELNKKA